MRSVIFTAMCLVLLATLGSPLLAGGKAIVIDSNVNGKITAKIYAQTDPRLVKKVSYEATVKTVEQIVDDLQELTGIEFIAGARQTDWPVRSRKMNIYVKDVPLYELMDSIARVMKFRWSRSDDKMIYRLKINNKAAAEADAMMKRAESEQVKMWQKRRQGWADAIDTYGDKSADELSSLRETNPEIFEQAQLGSLQAIHALFDEVPETKERFLAGRNFRVSVDDLDPNTKSLLFNAGNEFWKHLERIGYITGTKTQTPKGYGDRLKANDHFDIVYKRLDVGTFTPNLRWGTASRNDTGYWNLDKDGIDSEINGLRYMGTPWSKHIALGNIRINDGVDVDTVRADEQESRNNAWVTSSKFYGDLEEKLYPSEPVIEHKPFPELEKKIDVKERQREPDENPAKGQALEVAFLQKLIADASGLGVVSDSWINIPYVSNSYLPEKATVGGWLEILSSTLNYNWDKPGSILEFRFRKWAKLRFSQIPESWVAKWSENTKKNGYLSLDDLSEISNLSYYQAEESVWNDPVIGMQGIYYSMLNILDDNLTWLRLYASLKSQQKNILKERGLGGHMLTSEQWAIAQQMFDRIGITRGDACMQSNKIDIQVPNDMQVWFKEIDESTGRTDRYWIIRLPCYTPKK